MNGLLDCPHYTRPEVYEGEAVPPVLLSGNHAEIARWRLKQALGGRGSGGRICWSSARSPTRERALLDEYRKEAQGA